MITPLKKLKWFVAAFLSMIGSGLLPASASPEPVWAAHPQQLLYMSTLNFASGKGTIIVYPAYGKHGAPLATIKIPTGQAEGLWTDRNGYLYAAIVNAGFQGQGLIYVYKPGATRPFLTYTQGIDGPADGAFDDAGNLYVANLCGPPGQGSGGCFVFAKGMPRGLGLDREAGDTTDLHGYVAVFRKGKLAPFEYLKGSINLAEGVAVDHHGNVFVSNFTGTTPGCQFFEFPAGSRIAKTLPLQGLRDSICYKELFDANGDLIVTDSDVLFYPPPFGKPGHALTSGITVAMGMALGPDGSLFVGNYLITNNYGNAVVFAPGSTHPARTYSVPFGDAVLGIAVGAGL